MLNADAIAGLLRDAGRPIEELRSLLDFGCGCGRVARNWARLDGVDVHGCDYNPLLVDWCAENLPFLTARRNELEPPLPYEDEQFEFAYAISIFTHLPLDMQHRWIAELRRVLSPGGLLLVTLAGTRYADQFLAGAKRAAFDGGQPVVLRQRLAGTNGCFSLHPYEWAKDELFKGFELASFTPHDEAIGQDVYLAIKR